MLGYVRDCSVAGEEGSAEVVTDSGEGIGQFGQIHGWDFSPLIAAAEKRAI